jgi:hypothetical protein
LARGKSGGGVRSRGTRRGRDWRGGGDGEEENTLIGELGRLGGGEDDSEAETVKRRAGDAFGGWEEEEVKRRVCATEEDLCKRRPRGESSFKLASRLDGLGDADFGSLESSFLVGDN